MSVIDKTSVANVVAGAVVIIGIISSVFAPADADLTLVQSMALAAIGYLFGAATRFSTIPFLRNSKSNFCVKSL